LVSRVAVAVVVIIVSAAGSAVANAAGLTVSDGGQVAVPVLSPETVGATPTGSCDEPFTLESNCPVGSWPTLGGEWGSVLPVAGGDTLALQFETAASAVTVASTSNYIPGLTDPSGDPVANYDVLPAIGASATDNPAIWQVALPQLDVRAMSGYTFSVVAVQEEVSHDFAFTIRAPRYENEAHPCGTEYLSTNLTQFLCDENAPPPGGVSVGPPVARDRPPVPPVFSLSPHATASKGHIRLRFTVGALGTLRVHLVVPGVAHRVISENVATTGEVTLDLSLRKFHPGRHRIRVLATLQTRGATLSLERTLRVT
jgi:hypothetical protein